MTELACINTAQCGQAFAGVVKFCPYCGSSQKVESEHRHKDQAFPEKADKHENTPVQRQPVIEKKAAAKPVVKNNIPTINRAQPEQQDVQSSLTIEKSGHRPRSVTKPSLFSRLCWLIKRLLKWGFYGALAVFGLIFIVALLDKKEPATSSEASRPASENQLAARPQKVTPKTPEKPILFGLFVDTKPADARIRILNITPKFQQGIKLKKGRYHVEVSRSGYQSMRLWVNLDENSKRFSVTLKKLLTMNVVGLPPGGRALTIDGDFVDLPMKLPKGSHRYVLSAPGYSQAAFTFHVSGDGNHRVELDKLQCATQQVGARGKATYQLKEMSSISKRQFLNGVYVFFDSFKDSRNQLSRQGSTIYFDQYFSGKEYYIAQKVELKRSGNRSVQFTQTREIKGGGFLSNIGGIFDETTAAVGQICESIETIY